MRRRVVFLAAAAGALAAVLSPAAAAQVEFTDLTPRFLAFYDSATARSATPAERWTLWERLYGFAAVPPTPAGRTRARELLDGAWDRYAEALPSIRAGAAAWPVTPERALDRVQAELGCGRPVRVRVTAFVGAFDGNAFTWTWPAGVLNVAIPVEAGDPEASLAHELTHAVHAVCSGAEVSYVQSLARLVFAEGLAVHAVGALLPDGEPTRRLKAPEDWIVRCRERGADVVRGILQELDLADRAVIERFTAGTGSTGMSREAYCAGWLLVGVMRERQGATLRALASLPADSVAAAVRAAAETYLSAHEAAR